MQKISLIAEPGGTYLEDLQGRLLKFGDHSKKLYISVEYFVKYLSNQNPPLATNQEFMSGCLILLDKLPGVLQVGAGETWCRIFSKKLLKVPGYEATHTCRDNQICTGLKVGIGGVVHRVQYIWKTNSTNEKCF